MDVSGGFAAGVGLIKPSIVFAAPGGRREARRGGLQDGGARRMSVGDLRDDAPGVGPESGAKAHVCGAQSETDAAEEYHHVNGWPMERAGQPIVQYN